MPNLAPLLRPQTERGQFVPATAILRCNAHFLGNEPRPTTQTAKTFGHLNVGWMGARNLAVIAIPFHLPKHFFFLGPKRLKYFTES